VDIASFQKQPILGILRGIELRILEPLLEAIMSADLETIEITMNTKDAAKLIRKAVAFSKKRLVVGAGTVMDKKDLRAALAAGATFIVSPVYIKDVTAYCVKNRIPVFPGALTPQEIYTAWENGATMVKVFPSSVFGPGYFKEVKGPFSDVKLLACGGVTSAVSFGASVFKKEWLAKKDFQSIGQSIKAFVDGFENYQGEKPS
jgi:2-dehydro-3-deoxyphosphogluconate aldolase/(4S)-4-hydroxy-2-oxoglutarate aldolase